MLSISLTVKQVMEKQCNEFCNFQNTSIPRPLRFPIWNEGKETSVGHLRAGPPPQLLVCSACSGFGGEVVPPLLW